MNLASWVIVICILFIVIWDIYYLLNHGMSECNGSCNSCGPKCKWTGDIEKARRRLAFKRKIKKLLHM
ncbi:MAG: hypothetical protein IJ875_03040 [Solobacterium sp.]|nr:hypothetical protein [Solobacterium sp.]